MYIWLKTTFGTVQKWSLRPLLDSPKGGLNTEILLYVSVILQSQSNAEHAHSVIKDQQNKSWENWGLRRV